MVLDSSLEERAIFEVKQKSFTKKTCCEMQQDIGDYRANTHGLIPNWQWLYVENHSK